MLTYTNTAERIEFSCENIPRGVKKSRCVDDTEKYGEMTMNDEESSIDRNDQIPIPVDWSTNIAYRDHRFCRSWFARPDKISRNVNAGGKIKKKSTNTDSLAIAISLLDSYIYY